MPELVLDASAVLAFVKLEPGHQVVREALPRAAISTVNVAEVLSKLSDFGMPMSDARVLVGGMPFDLVAFDGHSAFAAAQLRERTRQVGLSLGDRACLALAQQLGVPTLTGDRRWSGIDVGVEIRLIRG